MKRIAHRGFDDRRPENTLTAVREAATDADLIEIDVRRSGSGELVVIHHEFTTPISETTGRVSELTVAELDSIDVLGSGEGVPILDTVLRAIPPDVGIDVELKETGIAADALATLEGLENNVVVSSMEVEALEEVREIDRSIPLAYISDLRPVENVETALSLDCVAICPHRTLCFTTDIVSRAHEAGLNVYAWPVESRLQAQALEAAGVDGVIATSPAVFEPFSRARKAAYGSLLRASRTLDRDFEDVYFGALIGTYLLGTVLVGGVLAIGWRDRRWLVERILHRGDP